MLTTWNMQGSKAGTEQKWRTGVAKILTMSDVVCLQECGDVPESAIVKQTIQFTDPKGNQTSIKVYYWNQTSRGGITIVHHQWDVDGNRVNTAVVTPRILKTPVDATLVWPNGGATWRPALGVLLGKEWIFSFHAISPKGPDAPNMLARIAAFSGKSRWRVGADFNREPASFNGPLPGVICPPNQATYKADGPATQEYDYFMCSGNHLVVGEVITSLFLSDHWPVSFAF